MYRVTVGDEVFFSPKGELLSHILIQNNKFMEHPCSGRGVCGKCKVFVDGEEALSCQYRVNSDINVTLPKNYGIISETGIKENGRVTQNLCLALDIGTTTLALALVSIDNKNVIKLVARSNPQRAFGADVISRIDYCQKNSVSHLHNSIIEEINSMIDEIGVENISVMYVSGNTTMLHLLLGEDPTSMGVAPYTPVFLESRVEQGVDVGIKNVEYIETLPCISAFVGADLVAGMNSVGFPSEGEYNLLVDLGTNAEIVLFSKVRVLCTSAAAGPCFEGVNITCGMNATDGAIASFNIDNNGKKQFKTVNNTKPEGICGTGLIDVIAELLRCGIIDETGYMECGSYDIAEGVFLSQNDIRQYQLAKSAVYSGIISLINKAEISFSHINKMYISGGFSSKINLENAFFTGLLPEKLKDKTQSIFNSSLSGTIKYACDKNNLNSCIENIQYVDLASDSAFSDLFIENMEF